MASLLAISADNNDIDLPVGTVIKGAWLVGGAAAAGIAEIYDSLTVTGTAVATLKAAIGDTSCFIDLCGVKFKTGISIDMTGAGAILHLVIE